MSHIQTIAKIEEKSKGENIKKPKQGILSGFQVSQPKSSLSKRLGEKL
jgi:hypothetical protein